jgi:hypothetical protein
LTAEEIENHFHNVEDWFGAAATPDGEDHVADDITDGTLSAFQIDAGNDDWGAWVQILGAEDTPNRAGNTKFDLHRIQVVASETVNVAAFIQLASGATGDAGVTAGKYTTIPYLTPTNQAAESFIDVRTRRCDAGEKVWARCLAVGENTMTLDFYIGLHEYVV